MIKPPVKIINGFHVGHSIMLTDDQVDQFYSLVNSPSVKTDTLLGGRRQVTYRDIEGLGPVVVKPYARGGWLGVFVKKTYLNTGIIRSRLEFEWLNLVREIGISAPEPLAFIWTGRLFYNCWLISRKLSDHNNLAELSLSDEDRAKKIIPEIKNQIMTLIRHDIFHVDLHPGNILIDRCDRSYIIDFDKARFGSGDEAELKSRYERRWQRAVLKHRLPSALNLVFS